MVRPFFNPEDPYYALPSSEVPAKCRRRSYKATLVFLSGFLLMGLLMGFIGMKSDIGPNVNGSSSVRSSENEKPTPVSRGVTKGVSEKSNRIFSGNNGEDSYPWNNSVLSWQRSAFHFQPQNNWMNDPNGPLYYKGWYHLFYQYNPNEAIWGDIVWGHAVSRDLIHWLHLPLAMVADQWYDLNGVWTGSATILHHGKIIMLYTGSTNTSVQVQNLAYPSNPNDPLLLDWVKYSGNPVIIPPPGIRPKDFRDPTTAWYTSKNKWRITIGSRVNKTGLALVYETDDFKNFEILNGTLHQVSNVGMWECVDFYPVSRISVNGLDTSINGDEVKHVMKASMDNDRHDYYAIGSYSEENVKWVPDDSSVDVGIGLRYDYGLFYASKTFFDPKKRRRVLWGWIDESDSENADVKKGWASLQSIPRTVVLDRKTGSDLLQWPVEEVESLRLNSTEFDKIEVKPGSVVSLPIGTATQLDIVAEFEVDEEALKGSDEDDEGEFSCGRGGGAARRGRLGPFGLLVLVDESLSEQTPVYFYIAKGSDGNLTTFFCTDQSRSSMANDVDKQIYGSIIPVLNGEKLTLRILVDHSIVESFAQKGRRCITARVYPTKAVYGGAKLFVFNNATSASIKASIKIWEMNSAFIHPYGNLMIMMRNSFPFAFVSLGFVCVCAIFGVLIVWIGREKRGDSNQPLL